LPPFGHFSLIRFAKARTAGAYQLQEDGLQVHGSA
jgi:hypothetical protein